MEERRQTHKPGLMDDIGDVVAVWVMILSLVVAIPYVLIIKPIIDLVRYFCKPTGKS